MPITIGPPTVPGPLSPGQLLTWTSDFIGPLPNGSFLSVTVSTDSDGQFQIGTGRYPTQVANGSFTMMDQLGSWSSSQYAAHENDTVYLQTRLHQGPTGTVIDSGTQQMTWAPSSNVWAVFPQQGQGTGGGLTEEQALQLQQTQQSTWPEHLVDQLTLVSLGTGSSTLPINANLTSPVFAVIVRLTAVPEDLAPQTPDGDYWVPTLATVRIYRGSDLWIRAPIHTSSKIVNLWIEGLALGLADAVLSAGWLLDLTLQTTFLPGVEGQVFLMRVP